MPYEVNETEITMEDVELSPLQRRTRFHVNRVDSMEGRTSLLGEQETKKSLRHLTREALPRLDNYRNILSIQAAHRPTLDELHDPSLLSKVKFFFKFKLFELTRENLFLKLEYFSKYLIRVINRIR